MKKSNTMYKNIVMAATFILFIASTASSQEQTSPQDSEFKTTKAFLQGDYISNCDVDQITLQVKKTEEKGLHLVQIINGNEIIWMRTSETSYVREEGDDYTITFDKSQAILRYTNYEGELCEWIKM